MGFALTIFFSAILLFSDLAHRKTSSASPANANALAAGDRNFKAVIVAMAPGVKTDLCADGMLEGLRQSGCGTPPTIRRQPLPLPPIATLGSPSKSNAYVLVYIFNINHIEVFLKTSLIMFSKTTIYGRLCK